MSVFNVRLFFSSRFWNNIKNISLSFRIGIIFQFFQDLFPDPVMWALLECKKIEILECFRSIRTLQCFKHAILDTQGNTPWNLPLSPREARSQQNLAKRRSILRFLGLHYDKNYLKCITVPKQSIECSTYINKVCCGIVVRELRSGQVATSARAKQRRKCNRYTVSWISKMNRIKLDYVIWYCALFTTVYDCVRMRDEMLI